MFTAASIRYGGLIVEASDCDHSSYKDLGLKCPICHRPVFLVEGSRRDATTRTNRNGTVSPVKEANVSSHFSHFSEVDRSIVDDCELRAKAITVTQKAAIAAKAQHQRLRILQSRLWSMINSSLTATDIEQSLTRLETLANLAFNGNELQARYLLGALVDFLVSKMKSPLSIDRVTSTLDNGAEAWLRECQNYVGSNSEISALFTGWSDRILQQKMHLQIVAEVYRFLMTNRQTPILEKLIRRSILRWISVASLSLLTDKTTEQVIEIFNSLDVEGEIKKLKDSQQLQRVMISVTSRLLTDSSPEMTRESFSFVRDDTAEVLFFVDWAEQFSKKETANV